MHFALSNVHYSLLMKKFNIVHYNTYPVGGAGIASKRINDACLRMGFDTVIEHKKKYYHKLLMFSLPIVKAFSLLFKFFILFIFTKRKYFFYSLFEPLGLRRKRYEISVRGLQIDVIFLHWVAGFYSLSFLKVFKETKTVFWYAMDMSPVTGGCHYNNGCDGYSRDCLNCPGMQFPLVEIPKSNFDKKIKMLSALNVCLLAPNTHALKELSKSSLPWHSIKLLPIPIDESIFRPKNFVNSEKHSLKFLFGSSDFSSNSRKGGDILISALKMIDENSDAWNNMPHISVDIPSDILHPEVVTNNYSLRFIPRVAGDYMLADLYNNYHFFINCPRDDLGPMMLAEASMCGLPSISVKSGLANDLVVDFTSGISIDSASPRALYNGLERAAGVSFRDWSVMSTSVREKARSFCSMEAFQRRLREILNELE